MAREGVKVWGQTLHSHGCWLLVGPVAFCSQLACFLLPLASSALRIASEHLPRRGINSQVFIQL